MSGTADEVKGRTKQAVGSLTGDHALERDGKTDRAAGTIKDKVQDAKEWVGDKVDDVKKKDAN